MSSTLAPTGPTYVPVRDELPNDETRIQEAATFPSSGAVVDDNGNVEVHIIRPTVGRGRGRHLYEADMLRENAGVFTGWRMFVDHQSPEARAAMKGLPRGVRELGGRVIESRWDPSVPADPDKGLGAGAVVGTVRPVPYIRELIENDPEILETSISAQATNVRGVTRGGQQVNLVEGIRPQPRGSVDWVTEAGAGGRVAPRLTEAFSSEEGIELALLESYSDEEFVDYVKNERPDIAEALAEAAPDPELEPEPEPDPETPPEEDDVITAEALREALQQPETREVFDDLVESRLDEERELIRAESRAHAQREVQLSKLEVDAHRQINEARHLPATWKALVREKFSINEAGVPSPALNIIDDFDDEGEIVKAAGDKLREAVDGELKRQQELLREAAPTRVRGQGARQPSEGETPPEPPSPKDRLWGQHLQEAGIDPEKAYAG